MNTVTPDLHNVAGEMRDQARVLEAVIYEPLQRDDPSKPFAIENIPAGVLTATAAEVNY